MTVSVFVSYSHDDVALVTPIVKLLRLNKTLVFQDMDSIELGRRWREQASRALAEARLIVLFWCVHSSRSSEVESEYRSALKTGKDLLPVLLDATPLPAELSEFQWIDFRGTVGANHTNVVIPPAAPMSTRSKVPASRSLRYSLFATIAVVLMIAGLSFWSLRSLKDMAPPTISAPEGLPVPKSAPRFAFSKRLVSVLRFHRGDRDSGGRISLAPESPSNNPISKNCSEGFQRVPTTNGR
jgi:hypothetical protein